MESDRMTILEPIHNRPESLTERVYDSIREAIVSRKLAPGDRVTEAKLAEQLQVSKTPVREALLQLEYIGLIESDGRRGGRIVTPSRDSIRSAYEIRTGLEAQAARIAAERGDPDLVDAAGSHAKSCLARAKKGDQPGFRKFDRKFHLALSTATGNPLLARFVHDAFDLTWALRRRDVPVATDSLECAKQHLHIIEAVESHGADEADAAMRQHIGKVQALVVAAFDEGKVPAHKSRGTALHSLRAC